MGLRPACRRIEIIDYTHLLRPCASPPLSADPAEFFTPVSHAVIPPSLGSGTDGDISDELIEDVD